MKKSVCVLLFILMFALSLYGSFSLGARYGLTQGIFLGANLAANMCQGTVPDENDDGN